MHKEKYTMPEMLTQSHLDLKVKTESFIKDTLVPLEEMLDHNGEPKSIREKVIAASTKAGLFTMTQPASYHGKEVSALELTVVRETLAAANLKISAHVFGPGPGVLATATGPLKENYLDPVMRGEKRGSFGFTEPDAAPRPTWAKQDGDEIIVTGQKSFVTGGGNADFVNALVNVEADGNVKGGTALVAIDFNAPGLTIEKEFRTLEGSDHLAIRFDEVRVPKWHIIGNIGEGMPRALEDISKVRLSLSAVACGYMQWAIDYVTEKLQQPHRSGTPMAKREGVRIRYADMRIEAFAARSMLYRTARMVDSDQNDVNEVMCTKVYCTEAAGRVIDAAVQLMGGNALTAGNPLERLYRQVRSMRFTEGASDILRINIAKGKFELGKGTL
jgi:alkylation response protein AidB-like acyl-CoA dehydrogenase